MLQCPPVVAVAVVVIKRQRKMRVGQSRRKLQRAFGTVTSHFPTRDVHVLARAHPLTLNDGLSQASMGTCKRSEEHTSELQSLMRISYAVFCLKKKRTKNKLNQH